MLKVPVSARMPSFSMPFTITATQAGWRAHTPSPQIPAAVLQLACASKLWAVIDKVWQYLPPLARTQRFESCSSIPTFKLPNVDPLHADFIIAHRYLQFRFTKIGEK